jgi:ribose transport system substrate-binding protein
MRVIGYAFLVDIVQSEPSDGAAVHSALPEKYFDKTYGFAKIERSELGSVVNPLTKVEDGIWPEGGDVRQLKMMRRELPKGGRSGKINFSGSFWRAVKNVERRETMKVKILACFTVVAFLLVAFAAQPPLARAEKPLKAALLISSMAFPFFGAMIDGAKDAGKLFNVEVTPYDGENEPGKQTSQVEDAIAAKYDAILLNPVSAEALVPAVKRANEAGIPVFSLDRDVVGGDRVCYIGTSNVTAAEAGAKTLIKALEASGKPKPWKVIHLWGTPGASSAQERSQGVHNVLDPLVADKTVEMVADLTAQFNKPQGMKVTEDILATTSDIHAVITGNDDMALGAMEALKGAGVKVGFPDGVIIVGFDAIDPAVAAVERGEMYCTVAQAPFVMGYWGVEAMANHIRDGWTPPAGTPTYEPTGAVFIKTPTVMILPFKQLVDSLTRTPSPLP